MRTLAAVIALSSLSAAAHAQMTAQNPAQPAAKPACALPLVADTVELEDVPGTGLRTVPVVINGTKKQFLLDIATTDTEVSEATVSQLALPDARNAPTDSLNLAPGVDTYKEQTGKANFDMNMAVAGAFFNVKGATGADNYLPHVRIASFTMGGATGKNLTFVIAKDAGMGKAKDKPYGMGQQIYIHTFPRISFAGGVTAVNVPARIQSYSLVHDLHREPVLGSRATFSVTPDIADLTLGMDVLAQLHLYIAPGRKTIYVTAAQ